MRALTNSTQAKGPHSSPHQEQSRYSVAKSIAGALVLLIMSGLIVANIANNQSLLSQIFQGTAYSTATTTSGSYRITHSTTPARKTPVEPQDYNLVQWAYYAMDWFDYRCSISDKLATRDSVFKMAAIYTFVQTYVTYKADASRNYAQSPYETLALKTGDCEDYAILMASLCEYVGLDASVDIVTASYGSQTPNELKQKNHAMCWIYFNLDENALQNALSNLRSIYQMSSPRFWWIKEPSRIIVRDSYGFTYVSSKYSSGLWASLENWDSLKIYVRVDYSNDYLVNFQTFRDLIDHPYVYPYFTYNSEWRGNILVVHVHVVNYGALAAKNVIAWIGLDAGGGKVYAQSTSTSFQLGYNERRDISLQMSAPKGVYTRLLVWVYGDNFNVIKSESSWFHT